jgi:sugar phosphate isomerase/epimerase
MYLANIWFGRRASTLPSQLQQAAELGFAGVGLLAGGISKGVEAGLDAAQTESSQVAVVDIGQLMPPQSPSLERFQWLEEDVPLLLRRLKQLRCAQLLVPGGLDARPGVGEKAEELLVRVRGGESFPGTSTAGASSGCECPESAFFGQLPALGWERQLSRLAAFLYKIRRQAPGLRIALRPEASPAGLLNPQRFALLQEEISTLKIGYWHDSGALETRFMATAEAPGEWLDSFSNIMQGTTLHDFSGGDTLLPPGLGQVDWQLLREYLPRAALRVLAAAPSYPVEVLAEARSTLTSRLQP